MTRSCLPMLVALLLPACAVKDSDIAQEARTRLMGMSEADLESCIGVPDQHSRFGNTDILTYYATSTSDINWSVPVVGGVGVTNGGYCHITFRVTSGTVSQIMYSGEKNATFAPDAYCTPILRTCIDQLRRSDLAACHPAHPERWWITQCTAPSTHP